MTADAAAPLGALRAERPQLFGEMLRARRTALGLTLEDVARAVGATRQAISNMETKLRHTPNIATVYRMSVVLGLDFQDLCDAALATHLALGIHPEPGGPERAAAPNLMGDLARPVARDGGGA